MKRRKCKGNAIIECTLIIVALLLPVSISVIDFGYSLHARHVVEGAAREGAAAAARGEDALQKVTGYLEAAGLNPNLLTLDGPNYVPAAIPGAEVQVALTYSLEDFPIIPWGEVIPAMTQVGASAVMRYQ
jgi:Flp pilus assembly protein TadG